MNYIEQVAQFHKTFNHPIQAQPNIPSEKRSALRVQLIQEELDELRQAIQEQDLVECADAYCDIMYVLSGAILEFGLQEKFNELFAEVQRSNMSKACTSQAEAEENVAHYAAEGIACRFEQVGDKYVVYRQSDGKVMKNIHYSPANLSAILNA